MAHFSSLGKNPRAESDLPDPDKFYQADSYPQPLTLEEERAKVELPEVLAAITYTTTLPLQALVSPAGEYVKHKMLMIYTWLRWKPQPIMSRSCASVKSC